MTSLATFTVLLNTLAIKTIQELIDIYILIANGIKRSKVSQMEAFQIIAGAILQYIESGNLREAEGLLMRLTSNNSSIRLGKLSLYRELKSAAADAKLIV